MPGRTRPRGWEKYDEDFDPVPDSPLGSMSEITELVLTPKQIAAEEKFQRRKRKKGFGFHALDSE